MNGPENETLSWDLDRMCWNSDEPIGKQDRKALVRRYTPLPVFPGPADSTSAMVVFLCPLAMLAETASDEPRNKRSQINFEHKISTPGDDEYWFVGSKSL